MLPFKLVYSDDYYLPIGAHVFPAEKYRLVHRRLLETLSTNSGADHTSMRRAGEPWGAPAIRRASRVEKAVCGGWG